LKILQAIQSSSSASALVQVGLAAGGVSLISVADPFASAGSAPDLSHLGNEIAHVLGHSLGMQHDVQSGFVMSPLVGSDAVAFSAAGSALVRGKSEPLTMYIPLVPDDPEVRSVARAPWTS